MSIAKFFEERWHARPAIPRNWRKSAVGLDLIGMDMAPGHKNNRNRLKIAAIAAGVVLAALAVVGMRNDLTRMRYAAAEALRVEQALRGEKLAITVEKRILRDPQLLARRAKEFGFVHPERVIDLSGALPTEASLASTGPRP
jgi:hypothetical protein